MKSNDRRKTFRCRVTPQQQSAVLLVGSVRYPAQVLDESASGFAVLLDEAPAVEPHQVLRLATAGGVSQVGVIDVQQEDSAYRVGLRRLHDLPERAPSRFSLLGFRRKRDLRETPAPLPRFGLGLAALGAMVLLLVAWKVVFSDGAAAEKTSSRPVQPLGATAKAAPAPTQPAPASRRASGVPAAAVFTLPLVADQLQLSAEQQARINAIAQRTFSPQTGSENNTLAMSGPTAPLDQTLNEALSVLTEEQRRQWATMVGAKNQ